jgi:lipopolysaccharide export LptBFGC system permease protein LptF
MKLQLYVLRSLLMSFGFSLGAIVVLAVPGVAVSAVSRLAGVDTLTLLLFMPLLLSEFVPYVLPVCFLLAVVFTYGRLDADSEWTVIRMTGMHPLRLVMPGAVLALLLSGFTLWMVAEQLPRICREQKYYEISASRTLLQNLSPGRTEIQFGKFYLSAISRDGDDFLEVLVYLPPRGTEPPQKLLADRVHFEFRDSDVLVHLTGARTVSASAEYRSGNPVIRIDLDELQGSRGGTPGSMRYRESSELEAELAAGGLRQERADAIRYEIQQRRATATTCFVFLLLGISTGLRLWRRSQLLAIALAVAYALVYYVLSMRLGHVLVESQLLSPGRGAWVLSAIGGLVGFAFLRRSLGLR